MVVQNAENVVAWGGQGALKVMAMQPFNRAHTTS